MSELTCFTVADQNYEPWVLPFAAAMLWSNPDAHVEIALPNPRQFREDNIVAVHQVLTEDRFLLRGADFGQVVNSVRFLTEPRTRSDYLYIADIDILTVEPIMPARLKHMTETGLPYSNVLRPPQPGRPSQLTGLHFTEWDAWVPLTPTPPHARPNLDEQLLYDLVVARGLPLPDPGDTYRPAHGYHLSLNRDPRPPGLPWGGLRNEAYAERFFDLQRTHVWQTLGPLFDVRFRRVLAILETWLSAKYPHLAGDFAPTPGTDLRTLWA